jgi:hypothetical protein
MRRIDSPSIVPDQHLTAAVSLLVTLAHAKREGDADALNDARHLFETIPGLRGAVHSMAVGASQSEVQGARSRDRKRKYARRKVERARAYRLRRDDPAYREMSDSDLKAWCGQRLVRDPTSEGKYLPILKRRQAINAIDDGLALIATGRFALQAG